MRVSRSLCLFWNYMGSRWKLLTRFVWAQSAVPCLNVRARAHRIVFYIVRLWAQNATAEWKTMHFPILRVSSRSTYTNISVGLCGVHSIYAGYLIWCVVLASSLKPLILFWRTFQTSIYAESINMPHTTNQPKLFAACFRLVYYANAHRSLAAPPSSQHVYPLCTTHIGNTICVTCIYVHPKKHTHNHSPLPFEYMPLNAQTNIQSFAHTTCE